jgi:hypothetical protein
MEDAMRFVLIVKATRDPEAGGHAGRAAHCPDTVFHEEPWSVFVK